MKCCFYTWLLESPLDQKCKHFQLRCIVCVKTTFITEIMSEASLQSLHFLTVIRAMRIKKRSISICIRSEKSLQYNYQIPALHLLNTSNLSFSHNNSEDIAENRASHLNWYKFICTGARGTWLTQLLPKHSHNKEQRIFVLIRLVFKLGVMTDSRNSRNTQQNPTLVINRAVTS